MAREAQINGVVFWEDATGRLIPKSQVRGEDELKDKLLGEIVSRWNQAQEALKGLKQWIYEEVEAYLNLLQENYGAKPRKSESLTLQDFSGQFRLEIKVAHLIAFDERLQIAKGLIDQCIERWSYGSDPNLVTVIKDAFRVNQEGKVSIPRVLGLKRLSIQDSQWEKAMEAIHDSIIIEQTKKYIRLYQRVHSVEGKWQALPLDLAAL